MAQIGMRPLIVGVVSVERRRVSPRPRIFNFSFGSWLNISFWRRLAELPKLDSCGVLRPLFTATAAGGKVFLSRKAKHLPRMTLLFLLYSVVVVVAWVAFFDL